MREIRVGGIVKRRVEDVFAVLSNRENAPKWSLNALEEELTSPRPVGVGATRRAVVKSFGGRTTENHAVCTEFVPNRRIAWQSTSAVVPFHITVVHALGWRYPDRPHLDVGAEGHLASDGSASRLDVQDRNAT